MNINVIKLNKFIDILVNILEFKYICIQFHMIIVIKIDMFSFIWLIIFQSESFAHNASLNV